jgi:hypothetical protein
MRARPDPPPSVREVRTYDESEDKVYAFKRPSRADDASSSFATLVPGGRPADRPSQAGAVYEEARREASRPLKINVDLQLVR